MFLGCQPTGAGGRTNGSCAALGLQCETVNGKPTCVPGAAAKCTGDSLRCDHASSVKCIDGHEVRVQCNQANLVCGIDSDEMSRIGACATSPYSSSGDECDPKKFATRCRGTDVEYCVGGRVQKYNCKTYFGMTQCVGRPGQAHCSK